MQGIRIHKRALVRHFAGRPLMQLTSERRGAATQSSSYAIECVRDEATSVRIASFLAGSDEATFVADPVLELNRFRGGSCAGAEPLARVWG